MPPNPELVDLIEQAFLEGQIDSQKAELAHAYLKHEAGNSYGMPKQQFVDQTPCIEK